MNMKQKNVIITKKLRNMIYLSMENGCAPIVAVEDGAVSSDSMYNCRAGVDGYHCKFPEVAPKCELDCYNNSI